MQGFDVTAGGTVLSHGLGHLLQLTCCRVVVSKLAGVVTSCWLLRGHRPLGLFVDHLCLRNHFGLLNFAGSGAAVNCLTIC